MDHDILKQALSLLSERFSVLRTAFVYEGMKEILQVVLKNRDPEVNYIDITEKSMEMFGKMQNQMNYYMDKKLVTA